MVKDLSILEQDVRMSESLLWKLQYSAYIDFGPIAWIEKGVPFYLTSNPSTAKIYAHVVLGYLRDCAAPSAATPLDLSQPLYIFDLGAGVGRFGFLFLKNLFRLLNGLSLEDIKIVYVMTDIVQRNIDFCTQHFQLREYIEKGVLDFASYHHADPIDKSLQLLNSKTVLKKGGVANPLILIANYFFDTIPQDLFFIRNGMLDEGRITIRGEAEAGDVLDATIIRDMEYSYSYVPIVDVDTYYSDFSELSVILRKYLSCFDKIPFLFPIGAFQSLKYFLELSSNRLLLLAGDQGVVTEEQIRNWGEPNIAKHGTFSIAVSYHAISEFFYNRRGTALLTTDSDPLYVVMAGIAGGSAGLFPETQHAFEENIDHFEPKDYWKLAGAIEKEQLKLPLESILTILKLGNWDPMNFYTFFDTIRKQIPDATANLKERLLKAIHHIWENFYQVSHQEAKFIMNLGVLCYEMHFYSEALIYFQHALGIGGEDRQIYMNMSACYMAIGETEIAKQYFNKAKSLANVVQNSN